MHEIPPADCIIVDEGEKPCRKSSLMTEAAVVKEFLTKWTEDPYGPYSRELRKRRLALGRKRKSGPKRVRVARGRSFADILKRKCKIKG